MKLKIGFIGAGKMATALACGWLRAGLTTAQFLRASDPVLPARDAFHSATGALAEEDNGPVVDFAEILVLATKPQQLPDVLTRLRDRITPNHLVLSIAAGISLQRMESIVGPDRRVIRVMPNTPCLVNASASAFAVGSAASPKDAKTVETLLNAVGKGFEVPEKYLDAVTGLSGSGPAFVFMMIEALSDGGVRVGLPRDLATQLAAQTLLGSAQMVLQTGQHPGVLKDQVASPGGTTIAGIHALEKAGLRGALMDAVDAATRRSLELGK